MVMLKGKFIAAAASLLVAASLLTGCGIAWQAGGSPDEYVIKEQSYKSSDVRSISLSTEVTDVIIEESNDDEIHLTVTGNSTAKEVLQVKAEENGGTLKVELKHKKRQLWFSIFKSRLVLEVPSETFESFKVKTATGDVTSVAIEADQLNLDSSTGDLELYGYTGKSMRVSTHTGDIRLLDVATADSKVNSNTGDVELRFDQLDGSADIKTDTGDIVMTVSDGITRGKTTINSSTGDVLVKLPQGQTDLSIDLVSSTGDVMTDFKGMSYDAKSEHRAEGTLGSGNQFKVSILTATGDIAVRD